MYFKMCFQNTELVILGLIFERSDFDYTRGDSEKFVPTVFQVKLKEKHKNDKSATREHRASKKYCVHQNIYMYSFSIYYNYVFHIGYLSLKLSAGVIAGQQDV